MSNEKEIRNGRPSFAPQVGAPLYALEYSDKFKLVYASGSGMIAVIRVRGRPVHLTVGCPHTSAPGRHLHARARSERRRRTALSSADTQDGGGLFERWLAG